MLMIYLLTHFFFFFFNDTATTEIYTLSLHDALPISRPSSRFATGSELSRSKKHQSRPPRWKHARLLRSDLPDRKSTRLNSSHLVISYAVFCLKKKKKTRNQYIDYALSATMRASPYRT